MELEEAIKHLKYKIKNNLVISRHNSKDYESIETVLEALKNYKRRYEMAMEQSVKDYENSIPKKRIEDKIEELKKQRIKAGEIGKISMGITLTERIICLEELLKE